MTKKKKILLISLGSLLVLLLFIATILPLIVRSQAVKAIAAETGRRVRIEKVAINPLTLAVTVRGFVIEEAGGGPFISIAEMKASLGLASLYKGAIIVSEITVDTPSVVFARLEANKYSFNDIIELQKAKPPKPKSETRFSINNIRLKSGSVDFDDRAVQGGKKHTVRGLDVAIPFISNIPYMVEKYTDPRISAVVNGAPFDFAGKTKPLSKSLETSVHIDLKKLDLPYYLAYSPVPPPADLVSGKLDVDADVTYRVHSDKKPQLQIKGIARLDTVAVNLKGGKPLLKLPRFELKAALLEVLAGRFTFDSVAFDGLELFVSRNQRGDWMYSSLLPKGSGAEKPAGQKPAANPAENEQKQPPLVQIASFEFRNGTVHFSDDQPTGGFRDTVREIDLGITGFSTETGKAADYELAMLLDSDTNFAADGTFTLSPLSATSSAELTGLKIQRGWPYLSRFLTAPVKGTVDLSAETTFTKDDGLTVTEGSLLLTGVSARYGDKDGLDLPRFEITGAGFSQKENSASIAEIRLSKGTITLSRETDGSISLLSLLKKPAAVTPAGGAAASGAAAPAVQKTKAPSGKQQKTGKEFTYRLKRVMIDRLNATFIDRSFEDQPRFTLANTVLSLANLNGPRFTPAALRFSATFNKGTPLKAAGAITPQPFHYKGTVDIGRLPIRDFEDYFPANLNVFLLGGTVDTGMTVDIALKEGKPTGSFKGTAGVRGFHAVDAAAEEDLLKWESLQLDDIQGNLEPFSLAMKEIALNNVYSRIIIRPDGTLNLQNLVQKDQQKPGQQPQAQPAAKPAAAQPASPTAATSASTQPAAKKQIRVDAVTIQGGTLSFTDNHLPQRFSTTFFNLGGRVSGLTSEESRFADVDLRGNLENHSPLRITGSINPLRDDLFVDLKVSFLDIDLAPATPYTGRFLGYTVEKGKLSLDLKYHIDKKQLDSENKIFIDQFTFGERVESDKATKLPVKLGLALLKDRKGEIHLDVPVTGRTDDPKFSIWKLVFQVVQNLLVKAVTSPFSLLSSMFGGGQDFSAVAFSAGSNTLSPAEEQKLAALAKALLDRPALKIELKGFVDRERDAEGYRNELLQRKLRNEKLQALVKAGTAREGDSAGALQVTPEEYPVYLKAVYKKEKFPKPRNAIGFVKDLPPDEMKKLIIANTVVGDPELQELARERVTAVYANLVTKGTVPAERVFQKNDNIFKAPEKDSAARSRVELNAIAP